MLVVRRHDVTDAQRARDRPVCGANRQELGAVIAADRAVRDEVTVVGYENAFALLSRSAREFRESLRMSAGPDSVQCAARRLRLRKRVAGQRLDEVAVCVEAAEILVGTDALEITNGRELAHHHSHLAIG